MKNKITGIVMLAIMVSSGFLCAVTSEFRSPLTILRGPLHYPLAPVEHDIWSFKIDKIDECPSLWSTDLWVTGYGRTADVAYYDCCNPTVFCKTSCSSSGCNDSCCVCPKTRTTSNTASLAQLFFGKSTFRGEEAFANGMIPATECTKTPALMFSKLSPRFDYNEHGAVFGLHTERKLNECSCWHFGARLYFPVKVIEVEQRRSCGSEVIEEDYGRVRVDYQQRINPTDAPLSNVYAYRLDFLSALCWTDGSPLVNYGDSANLTTIANIPANVFTDWPKAEGGIAPVSVIYANEGYLPAPKEVEIPYTPAQEPYPLARPIVESGGTGFDINKQLLNGAGTGSNYKRYQFGKPNDYAAGLALDHDAQSKLFLVPNTRSQSGQGILNQDGLLIQNKIEYLLGQLDLTERNSALQFFRDHCVCFCLSDYITGIGDFDTELYVGYGNDCWYLDGIFGVRFPTGKDPDDARRIYYQSLGNKGHYEIKGALEGGWHPWDCFALKYYLSYYYVVSAKECRAPAFCGSTTKNIPAGCPVQADVKWSYFWGDLFMTFFHPNCQNCGATFGYELYAKTRDKVSFCSNSSYDFFNKEQRLDPCILECNTNTMTHKILGELFHRIGYCELFGGGSLVVAGRDAMKEREWHLGAAVYF